MRLKGISITLIVLLVMQLFTPGAFATYQPTSNREKELNFLSISTKGEGEDEGIVEVVSLDINDYYSLLDRSSNVTFDGFGNKDTYEEYKAMERGQLSAPGAKNASKQFLISNSGEPVMLYDTLNQRVVNPSEAPYISQILTTGHISYTTSVDKTTRVCSEYPDIDCASGHLNPTEIAELNQEINSLESKITRKLETIHSKALDIQDTLDVTDLTEEAREKVMEEYNITLYKEKEKLEELKNKVEDRSPLNTIQSNYSISHLTHASTVLLFPYHLSKYIDFLADLAPQERMYAIGQIAAAVVGIADASGSLKSGKLASKGVDGISGGRFGTNIDTLSGSLKGLSDQAIDSSKVPKLADSLGFTQKVTDQGVTYTKGAKGGLTYTEEGMQSLLNSHKTSIINDAQKAADAGAGIGKKSDQADAVRKAFSEADGFGKTTKGEAFLHTTDYKTLEKTDTVFAGKLKSLTRGDPSAWENVDKGRRGYGEAADLLRNLGIDDAESAGSSFMKGMGGDEVVKLGGRYGELSSLKGVTDTADLLTMASSTGFRAKGLLYLKRGLAMFRNAVQIQRGFLGITFFLRAFGEQPTSTLELVTLSIEATPQRSIQSKNSYFEIAKADERTYGKDVYPADIFTNLKDYFNFNLFDVMADESDAETVENKLKTNPGPDYVMVVDQESSAETYSNPPINLVLPQTIEGQSKWMMNNRNPTTTNYHAFENPESYAGNSKNRFSTMVLRIKNLDLSGMAPVENDWATDKWSFLTDMTPTTTEMLFASSLVGASAGIAGIPTGATGPAVMRTILSVFIVKGFGSLTTSQAERVSSQRYGTILDVGEAYSNKDQVCSEVLEESKDEIGGWGSLMWYTLALDAFGSGLSLTGIGTAPGTVISIIGSITNYWTTREYEKAKTEGLDDMKNCQETEFDVLAYKIMNKENQESEGIIDSISGQLGDSISKIPGIDSISPEVNQKINNLGQTAYLNTMSLNGVIEGQSLINFLGTELYQIHFDREAEIKWFLEEEQNIEFCDVVGRDSYGDPQFKCMMKKGYQLLDSQGNSILTAPQIQGFKWDNGRQLMTIPQKVINVKISKEQDPLMDIKRTEVDIEKKVVDEAVEDVTKNTRTSKVFGNLELVKTTDALIWQEGKTTIVKLTDPIMQNLGQGQELRYDDSHIQLHRNNEVEIHSDSDNEKLLDYTFELGKDGFISFTNAKIVPGTGKHEVTVDGEKETKDFSQWNHVMIYDLLTFSAENAEGYSLQELCEEYEEGKWSGFKLQSALDIEDSSIATKALEEICFSHIKGANNQSINIRDNQVCYTDAKGNTVCREILGFENGRMQLDGGYELGVERGPDGQPQFIFYKDGKAYGSPIPLLRGTGLGGMINFNPDTGKISISNEFPFQINSQFGRLGMGMDNQGMVVPQQNPWGDRPSQPDGTIGPKPQPSPLAQLPSVPQNPLILMAFILTILGGVVAIRRRDSD